MKIIYLLIGCTTFLLMTYQILSGFPIASKWKERKRIKKWENRQKINADNLEKIKLLDKQLQGDNEIEKYIVLNRFNLPNDKAWAPYLQDLIQDLLSIGWTTEMPIYTKYKYGKYDFTIENAPQEIIYRSNDIIYKYHCKANGFEWNEDLNDHI